MTTATVAFTVVLLLLFLLQGVRAIGQPRVMAARFGLPLPQGDAGAFVRVYASRNLAIVAAASVLLALRDARGVAIVLTCAVPLTFFDMAMVGRAARVHVVALVLLASACGLWWRQAL